MTKRYDLLRKIGLLLKIMGVFELIIGVFSMILLPLALSGTDSVFTQFGLLDPKPGFGLLIGIILGVVVLIIGLVCGLLTFSMGELFNVVISIEENTRASMLLLQGQKNGS